MLKVRPWMLLSALIFLAVACAPQEPPDTPSPAVLQPVNKARDAAQDAQQKAAEREQQDPEKQPEQSGQ